MLYFYSKNETWNCEIQRNNCYLYTLKQSLQSTPTNHINVSNNMETFSGD